MAIIVTQTADNAYRIQDAFRHDKRDYYPLGVYEAIYNYIQETHGDADYYELDVTAWWRNISETDLESANQPLRAQGFDEVDGGLFTIDSLASTIAEDTNVIYVDEENEIVYHIAY